MKRRAVIILNANLTDFSILPNYISKNDFIIAADGGANYLKKLGIKPNVIIGDFDSTDSLEISGVEYVKFPSEKDFTDSELALDFAASKNISEITIYGLLGDRVDHILANIFLLTKKKYKKLNIKIIEGNQEIYLASGEVKIEGKIGQTISLIPLLGDVEVESSSGLKYDPAIYKMSTESNIGISNVLTKTKAKIKIKKGKLLIIHTLSS